MIAASSLPRAPDFVFNYLADSTFVYSEYLCYSVIRVRPRCVKASNFRGLFACKFCATTSLYVCCVRSCFKMLRIDALSLLTKVIYFRSFGYLALSHLVENAVRSLFAVSCQLAVASRIGVSLPYPALRIIASIFDGVAVREVVFAIIVSKAESMRFTLDIAFVGVSRASKSRLFTATALAITFGDVARIRHVNSLRELAALRGATNIAGAFTFSTFSHIRGEFSSAEVL